MAMGNRRDRGGWPDCEVPQRRKCARRRAPCQSPERRAHLAGGFALRRAAQYFFILALTAFRCAALIFLTFRATVLTCRVRRSRWYSLPTPPSAPMASRTFPSCASRKPSSVRSADSTCPNLLDFATVDRPPETVQLGFRGRPSFVGQIRTKRQHRRTPRVHLRSRPRFTLCTDQIPRASCER